MENVDGRQLYAISAILHDASEKILYDDMYDVGYFSYMGRTKGNPHIGWGTGNHPSPIHHWPIGLTGMLISKILGIVSVAKQISEDDEQELEQESIILKDTTSNQPKEIEYFKRIM